MDFKLQRRPGSKTLAGYRRVLSSTCALGSLAALFAYRIPTAYYRQRMQLRAATLRHRAYIPLATLYGTVSGELSGRSPGHSSIFHGALPPSERSSLSVAPANFIRAITKPGET
ncbi:hypothetical protein VTO73DRAFT_15142 [Trametes versicolor]